MTSNFMKLKVNPLISEELREDFETGRLSDAEARDIMVNECMDAFILQMQRGSKAEESLKETLKKAKEEINSDAWFIQTHARLRKTMRVALDKAFDTRMPNVSRAEKNLCEDYILFCCLGELFFGRTVVEDPQDPNPSHIMLLLRGENAYRLISCISIAVFAYLETSTRRAASKGHVTGPLLGVCVNVCFPPLPDGDESWFGPIAHLNEQFWTILPQAWAAASVMDSSDSEKSAEHHTWHGTDLPS